MGLLETIDHPSKLKRLSRGQLPEVAHEIRELIIDVVSKRGGHLASSLGTVELAIALHYVFNTPADKIVWDVGHQAYAHKILTGRRQQFHTLRQYGGLSGFTRISESPFDAFTTGHSSTSISAALGIVSGRQINNDPAKVIAVIGDGSMTAGLAYEGLNQAGDLDKNLIIILNDNEMSISQNVGALSSFLSRTFSAKKAQDFIKDFGEAIKSLPKIGYDVYQFARRAKYSFKSFVTPGMLFDAFNIEYFGPIDGHNLNYLINILNNLKDLSGPALLHVKTQKGKDYNPAEKNPVYFHGCSCFDKETGRCLDTESTVPTYTNVFGNALVELAGIEKKIVAITAAMPEGSGLTTFAEAFPDRFFDVGIAEQHAVTFAAGLATEGFKPVVAIYSTFLQRAYDQILHDVCLESLPVIFAIDRAGLVGDDGPTHHGLFDISYLRSLPNMVIMAPKDENEFRHMLKTAIEHHGPIAIRYPRGQATGTPIENAMTSIPIGRAEIIRKGDDVLILAFGQSVTEAVKAYLTLSRQNITATVVNCRFAKPLDMDLISSLAEKIPRIITVEENVRQGGFGSAILEGLNDRGITGIHLERIGIEDTFVEQGPQDFLRDKYGVNYKAIVSAATRLARHHDYYQMKAAGTSY